MLRSVINLRRALVCGLGLSLALTRPASAQQTPLRFDVRAWPSGAVLAGAALGTLVPELAGNSLPHATCAPCDPSHLWGIDRAILGPVRTTAASFSDFTLLGASLGGMALLAHTRRGESAAAWREDAAVFVQAVGVTGAVTEWTKVLVHRPRPVRYGPDAAQHLHPTNGLSFPSGHTSMAFSAAAAYASILHRRGLAGRHKTEIAMLFTAAAATGALRVASRKHFPTDALAGAALGTAIGWTVPRLHPVR